MLDIVTSVGYDVHITQSLSNGQIVHRFHAWDRLSLLSLQSDLERGSSFNFHSGDHGSVVLIGDDLGESGHIAVKGLSVGNGLKVVSYFHVTSIINGAIWECVMTSFYNNIGDGFSSVPSVQI